jgi:hypothetical protein
MGVLASSDVDDDLLYQILVAFKNALSGSADTDCSTAVEILRCITKVVPATPRNGRYLSQIVWLAIALMNMVTSHSLRKPQLFSGHPSKH